MKITRVKFGILAVALICVVIFIGLMVCEPPYVARAAYDWGLGNPNQAILDDVQSFIRSKQIPQKDIEIIQYYGDRKTGRIGIVITTENHYSWWNRKDYIVYYDKNGARTKVSTFRYNHINM